MSCLVSARLSVSVCAYECALSSFSYIFIVSKFTVHNNNIDRKRKMCVSVSLNARACTLVYTREYTITLARFLHSISLNVFAFYYCDRFPMLSINIVILASSRHSHLVHFTNIARNMQCFARKPFNCASMCVANCVRFLLTRVIMKHEITKGKKATDPI